MIRRSRQGGSGVSLAVVALAGASSVVACNGESQIVAAVQTDLRLPDDLDEVEIHLEVEGKQVWEDTRPIGPEALRLPATLAILGEEGRALSVDVLGRQANVPKVRRRIRTTMPTANITSLLRVPLEWLCYGERWVDPKTGEQTCPEGTTCVAGVCRDDHVDDLPPYDDDDVFGGKDGTCFDVSACFAGATAVEVDAASCSFRVPAGLDGGVINVGLAVDGAGTCSEDGCFIPLDAGSPAGWTWHDEAKTTIDLTPGVCALPDGAGSVVVSSACGVQKTASQPPCSSASNPPPGSGTTGPGTVTTTTGPGGGDGGGSTSDTTTTTTTTGGGADPSSSSSSSTSDGGGGAGDGGSGPGTGAGDPGSGGGGSSGSGGMGPTEDLLGGVLTRMPASIVIDRSDAAGFLAFEFRDADGESLVAVCPADGCTGSTRHDIALEDGAFIDAFDISEGPDVEVVIARQNVSHAIGVVTDLDAGPPYVLESFAGLGASASRIEVRHDTGDDFFVARESTISRCDPVACAGGAIVTGAAATSEMKGSATEPSGLFWMTSTELRRCAGPTCFDGTPTSTLLLSNDSLVPRGMGVAGGRLYYLAQFRAWSCDGKPAGCGAPNGGPSSSNIKMIATNPQVGAVVVEAASQGRSTTLYRIPPGQPWGEEETLLVEGVVIDSIALDDTYLYYAGRESGVPGDGVVKRFRHDWP